MPILRRAGVSLHYKLNGVGPPVVFIHGVGVAGRGWEPQLDTLAREFETLILDNRGLGKSVPCTAPITIEAMAEDILAIMDDVRWESAHIVGHSMGGVIAQQVALNAPKRVRSLSLLCTFDSGKHAGRITPWILWMTLRTRLGPRPMKRRAFLEMLYPADYLRSSNLNKLAHQTGHVIRRDLGSSPPIIMKQFRATTRHDVKHRLGELAGIPTIVAAAEHDRIATPELGRALAAAIPGARYVEFAGTSHGVTIQKPEVVNTLLREHFLAAESTLAAR